MHLLVVAAAAAVPLAPASLLDFTWVGDPQLSGDGRRIAYVVARADRARDAYDADLWLIDGDAPPRPLVTGRSNDLRPRWSPDGRQLAFLSDRGGKPQVYLLAMNGGEAVAVTAEPEGVGAFSWSPDGTRIAYLARAPGPSTDPPPPSGRARVTERLYFRVDGVPGFLPESRAQLYVIAARPDAAGTRRGPLTDGRTDPSEPAWTPDGRTLIYSAARRADDPQLTESELFAVDGDGVGAPRALTDRIGPDAGPVVAPDGTLAWTGYDETTPPRASTTVRLYSRSGMDAPTVEVTSRLDRNVGERPATDSAWPRDARPGPGFAADGRWIHFVAADRGLTALYRARSDGSTIEPLSDALRGDLREFTVARDGRIAAVFGAPTQPYDIWVREPRRGTWTRRTRHGEDSVRGAYLSPYEPLEVGSFDGTRVQGWLLKPPAFDPTSRYPLLLYIHGGPHAMYGESFFHEFQLLAGQGYLVLITNPRGSTGYGQEFANIIQHRYPGDDHRDLLAAVDAVVARGYVDSARLGIAGGSGGGVLASWTIAQTDRFAAALVERPVVDFAQHALVSDFNGWFAERWVGELPWRAPEAYRGISPLYRIDDVKTPVLVIQSEQDYRTPLDQGIAYYSALRIAGKPARLALFPSSNHDLSRSGPPSQRVERLEIIRDWFAERFSRPPAAPRSAGG